MDKIVIEKNVCGDTRSATKCPTFREFEYANNAHNTNVQQIMKLLTDKLNKQAVNHDWTKTTEPYKSEFYRDLCNTIEHKIDFENDGTWLKKHYEIERHHLLANCPNSVNLIDVLEMIADCICAGLARTGKVRELEINNDILNRAVQNTVRLILDNVEVSGWDE